MVSSSQSPNPESTVAKGMIGVVSHAALQINVANGATIRVYRMFVPKGPARVVAERLRPGTLGVWDPIEEAEVRVEGTLEEAFSLSLGKLGPYLWSDPVP